MVVPHMHAAPSSGSIPSRRPPSVVCSRTPSDAVVARATAVQATAPSGVVTIWRCSTTTVPSRIGTGSAFFVRTKSKPAALRAVKAAAAG